MIETTAITGSIARAARIIDVLAKGPEGLSLAQIVAESEFSKTTVFRVLANLQDVGYVFQDLETRKYRLGQKLARIAQTACRTDIAAISKRGMQRLATLTEDTIFLSIPEGPAAICISRATGAFPIRTLTLNVGDTRPLGVGAGALALYCSMSEKERETIRRINKNWMADYGVSEAELAADFAAFQETGYAANFGRIVAGTSAISVPVMTGAGRLVAAIAIGAIDARMTPERINTVLIPAMREEAALLTQRIDEMEQG